MTQRFTQVDAFTDRAFAGNPAAVCILQGPVEARWMQQLANEMNLAETAFLYREGDAYRLRWFTPTVEVDLCGHATLASAHVLWEDGHLPPDEAAQFDTRSGRLTATRQGDLIQLDFPASPPDPCEPPEALRAALAWSPRFVGRNALDYLVELDSAEQVRTLAPDMQALATLPSRAVIVTSRADADEYEIISRCFAPAAGIPEDPVTGSAHCTLAAYWAPKLGKPSFTAYQASSRGGFVHVTLAGERALISGKAITVLRGELADAALPVGATGDAVAR
jgi:PhzF family phenazine biosynthesis protein